MSNIEVVTIRATEAVTALAAKALAIQDACNAVAVAGFLIDVQMHFINDPAQQHRGSDMGSQNPIAITVLNKLCDLAGGMEQRMDAVTACVLLADGQDTEFAIQFRN